MRNLKRALSLLLAAAMLIGMMVVGASAVSYNDFPDRDEIVNKDAVSMLTTLGIIEGTDQGTYNPTGDVDRAQMAKMISVALTNNEDCDTLYQNVNSGLTDIAANWARGYINYCYTLGIIAGRGDNTFDPSANVTGVEAAKMLLTALGYDANIEGLVGNDWALNTAALAQNLGIFRNFTKDVSAPLNRDDAALLIYNALDVELIQEYRNGYAISYDDHRTILSSVFGVIRVEGVVAGNEWAQLQRTDSEAALREGRTILEDVVWYDSTTANTVVDEGVRETAPVPFNVSTPVEYIGKAVTLYVEKTTILSNSKVIGVATNDEMNVVNATAATEDTAADYLKGTGVTVGDETEYYVNYGYCTTGADASEAICEHANLDLSEDYSSFNLNGIEVEVIDNNDDGTAEYVLYTMETLSEVRAYSERNELLSLYDYDRDNRGRLENEAVSFNVDLADLVMDETIELEAYDLVLYVQYGGRTYVTLPEIVTGTMARIDRDQDNELYITVNETEYRQSFIPDAASKLDPELTHFEITRANSEPGFDDAYDFILDSNGYVVAIRPAEEIVTNYGLVIESAWTQNALTKDGQVKIVKADGTEATYDIDWDASCGSTGDAFATEAGLEAYLGTRDVNNTHRDDTLNSAVGTVIVYTLNDDETELTIEKVLGLHDNVNGTTGRVQGTGEHIGDGNSTPAYIEANANAELAFMGTGNTPNLQWTLDQAYENGDASLNLNYTTTGVDVEYAVDLNTVAFYYYIDDNDTPADTSDDTVSYGAATGWNNMGDVKLTTEDIGVQVYPVEKKQADKTWVPTELAAVVLFNAETTVTSRDYMLVLNRNALTASDELWLNVVFEDGTTEEIQIDDDGNYNFDLSTSYMKAYAYVENADGTYDIVESSDIGSHTAELLLNGTVSSDHIYSLPGDAAIWDVTDVDSASDEVTAGTFNYLEVNSVIIPTTVGGRTIRTAFVWELDAESGRPEGASFTNYIDENDQGELELYYFGTMPKASEVRSLMEDYLRDGVRTARYYNPAVGSDYWEIIDDNGDSWYVYPVEMKRISFNGTNLYAQVGTSEQNNGNALSFTISLDLANDIANNDVRILEDAVTGVSGSGSVNINNRTVTYTGNLYDNVTLNLGYAITLTNVTGTLTGGGALGTYVAEGVSLTLTGGNSAGYAILANGAAISPVANGTTNVTCTYEMPDEPVDFTFGPANGADVGNLLLTSLSLNGQTVTLNQTNKTGYVTLPYSIWHSQNINVTASSPANSSPYALNLFDENDAKIVLGTTPYSTSTDQITVQLTYGSQSVNYTIDVTMTPANADATLTGISVKGVPATRMAGDPSVGSSGDPFEYEVELSFADARDTTLPQIAVQPTTGRTVAVTTAAAGISAGAVGNGTINVAGGRVVFTVAPESGTTLYYAVTITVDRSDRVGLKLDSLANGSFDGIAAGGVPSDTPITFKVNASAGYEVDKVTYTIAGESAVVLTPNADGSYTLTTAILGQAGGKDLTVSATFTALIAVSINTGDTVLINGKPVTDATDPYYVSAGDPLTVLVQAGEYITLSGTAGTDYGDYGIDAGASMEGFTAYTITNIQKAITITVNP